MPNGNQRGGTRDRRARKLFLLATFGDGETCPCWECGDPLTYETLVVDRIIPAILGGTYRRNNIRPHCRPCSDKSGSRIRQAKRTGTTVADHLSGTTCIPNTGSAASLGWGDWNR